MFKFSKLHKKRKSSNWFEQTVHSSGKDHASKAEVKNCTFCLLFSLGKIFQYVFKTFCCVQKPMKWYIHANVKSKSNVLKTWNKIVQNTLCPCKRSENVEMIRKRSIFVCPLDKGVVQTWKGGYYVTVGTTMF